MIFEPNHTISRYFAFTHKNIYTHAVNQSLQVQEQNEDPVAMVNSICKIFEQSRVPHRFQDTMI